jgi:hypothetical protein
MKTDKNPHVGETLIEVVNEQSLSLEEKQHLSKLRRLAKSKYKV